MSNFGFPIMYGMSISEFFWFHSSSIFLFFCSYIWLHSSRDDENVSIKMVFKKFRIFTESVLFMVYSNDSKGLGPKKNPDPEKIGSSYIATKRIVFIRHGESDWNNVFNKGINVMFIFRLLSAMWEEFKMLLSMDSKFLDSPLNHEGIEQALELRKFLENPKHPECTDDMKELLSIIQGDCGHSVMVTSSLRRAIATTTLALWPRIKKKKEKMYILSSLQEISRNVDTRALSGPKEIPDVPFSRIAGHCKFDDKSFDPELVFDASENFGNKPRTFYGIKRLKAFNEWVFQREESVVIAGGHSLWFKHFFQTYLPHGFSHDAKTKKITNSGVVSFTLQKARDENGESLFRIDPQSVTVIYGGFTTNVTLINGGVHAQVTKSINFFFWMPARND